MEDMMNFAPIHFSGIEDDKIEQEIIAALMEVQDPEIRMDIINLGLVYEVHMDEEKKLKILMTLTAIGCPLAGTIMNDVRNVLLGLGLFNDVEVELVWNPPWTTERVSRMARMVLGIR